MNTILLGHWYCSFCNDVVTIRKPVGRWDDRRGVTCPACRNNSAEWIDANRLVESAESKAHFKRVKEAAQ